MKPLPCRVALGLTGIALLLSGCGNGPATDGSTSNSSLETSDSHGEHAHPSEGPHHGELIELGNEEFHAELLHDESSVTIYVLNSAATEQVPIASTEITINAQHEGQPEQYVLTAMPDESDPEGKSSRFVSNDEELAHHIDGKGFDPKLVLTINGKSYRGTIAHDHDHGHDHDHEL